MNFLITFSPPLQPHPIILRKLNTASFPRYINLLIKSMITLSFILLQMMITII